MKSDALCQESKRNDSYQITFVGSFCVVQISKQLNLITKNISFTILYFVSLL
ncbi:hypothetical protein BN1088_1740007 [Sphingobacterium sp. PM2-P1-29]|nr:hypothetical protein BN1088_1740007 [Sphingobacterium sp. PM2-P1-29]